MILRHGPIQPSGLTRRRTGVMASEMVSRLSVVEPVARVMRAVGSGPSVLVTAAQMRIPSGHRHTIQVSVLSRTIVDRDIVFLGCCNCSSHHNLLCHPGPGLADFQPNAVEGSALKIHHCHCPENKSHRLPWLCHPEAQPKDPQLHFHASGWNTVPSLTAVQDFGLMQPTSDAPHDRAQKFLSRFIPLYNDATCSP